MPKAWKTRIMPRISPASPMRLTMNAFLPASDALFFLNQNPISRYEQSPTPSQPTNMSGQVAAQHQQQHEEGEEVQVREVADALLVVGHVAERVDVDERADRR